MMNNITFMYFIFDNKTWKKINEKSYINIAGYRISFHINIRRMKLA